MRKAKAERRTRETEIEVELDLDGSGEASVDTGIGFFDHMLELFARHSLVDLRVKAKGDLQVDFHHAHLYMLMKLHHFVGVTHVAVGQL